MKNAAAVMKANADKVPDRNGQGLLPRKNQEVFAKGICMNAAGFNNRNQLVNDLQFAQWLAMNARNRLERCLNQGRYKKGLAREYLKERRDIGKARAALAKDITG